LRGSFRDLGWVEGRNLTIEWRFSVAGTDEDLRALASELVGRKVHAIVASNSSAAEAARRATRSIPIVVLNVLDPVGAGLAQSLGRPGGNVTGVLYADPAFSAKTLQLMKETNPTLRKVGWLYPRSFPGIEPFLRAVEAAGQEMWMTVYLMPVTQPDDVDPALLAAKKEGIDAIRITTAGVLVAAQSRIREFAAANKWLDVYSLPSYVERGGFMSYSPKISDNAARGAALTDRILKGAKPAELPFEYPIRTELVLNLKAAKQRGISIPQSVLLRADRVIE
jgi:putative ABC transport system substrate-binding protein